MQAVPGLDNRCVMARLELLQIQGERAVSDTPVVLLQLVRLCLLQVVFPQQSIRDG